MVEMFIAVKHITERKRQTIVSTIGIAMGIIALIVSLGIANGLDNNMIDSILSMTAHIKVQDKNIRMENYNEKAKEIEKIKNVTGAMPKYSTQGIIKFDGKFGTFVSGVIIVGVQEETARKVLKLDEKIVEGKLDFTELDSIVIGKELSKEIGAEVGDILKIVSPESKELYLTIRGIYHSGYYDFDTTLVILPLKTVQILSDADDIVTEIEVMSKDVFKVNEIAKVIQEKLDLKTKTWGELNRNLLAALSLEKTVLLIILSLFVIVSGFIVGVILNTSVREKTKDIGLLRSVGYSSGSIMKIFLLEGAMLGAFGIFVGLIISTIIGVILKNFNFKLEFYYLDKIPFDISGFEVFKILLGVVFMIFLSSIYPAYKASKLSPVEALKYE